MGHVWHAAVTTIHLLMPAEYIVSLLPDAKAFVIGWLSHVTFYMAPQIIKCKMPSYTPNSITGYTDLLLSGEMSVHEI